MPFFTDFRAVYLPYCIEQQFDSTWVVLNRHYKLGFQHHRFHSLPRVSGCREDRGHRSWSIGEKAISQR